VYSALLANCGNDMSWEDKLSGLQKLLEYFRTFDGTGLASDGVMFQLETTVQSILQSIWSSDGILFQHKYSREFF